MNPSPRILIVEDNAVLVLDLQNILTQMGYQVVGKAATGKAAVELALAQKPDAILMDINLRGEMNGIQAAEDIHQQQDTPIIYLTAYTDEILLQQAKVTDAYAYLSKPVHERELRASLEMALYKHKAEQRLQHITQVLRAVRDVNQLITREHDAQRLMDEAVKILLRTRGYRLVWIGQPPQDFFKIFAYAGEGKELVDKIKAIATPDERQHLPGIEAAQTGRVVVCHDMFHDARYAPWREDIEAFNFQSTVAIPIAHQGDLFSMLVVYSEQPNHFDEEEVDLLAELAGDIAFGLKTIAEQAQRKHAEEALRTSEAHFRAVVENSYDGIILIGPDRKPVYVSPSYTHINGYSPEEWIGAYGPDYIHPDDRAYAASIFNQALQNPGKAQTAEYRLRHKKGHWFWVETNAINLLDDPDVKAVVLHSRDITKRKQTDEALRESEMRFRALSEDALVGIYIIQDGLFTYVNKTMTRIFGYEPEELVGASPLLITHPDDQALVTRNIRRRITGEANNLQYGIRGVRKNGEIIHIEIMSTRVDLDNRPTIIGNILDVTERKQRDQEMQAIAMLSAALRVAPTRVEMLPVIVEQMAYLLNADSISIEIIDQQSGDVIVEAAHGAWGSLVGARQAKGTGIDAIISQTLRPYRTHDFENDPNLFHYDLVPSGIRDSIGLPLIAQEKLIGFIWVGQKTSISEAGIRLISAIADIAANAIYRATLHEQTLKDAMDLTLAYDTTLEGWAHALELRDQETEGHARRVVQMTLDLARAMGMSEAQLEDARRGALLHDVGKMGIPDSVLLKPGTLDEHEWEIMRQHPGYAYGLLGPIEYLRLALDIPHYHHEKWDGTGYPQGLKGDQIPLAARIFAVVDVWDALTSDRPYRGAWLEEDALKYIRQQNGKHFDPNVVEVFLGMML